VRSINLVGILVFVILTVSNTSAFPIDILNKPLDEPTDANIQIGVTYDWANDQIIFRDASSNLNDPGITEVAYNISIDADIYSYDSKNNLIQSTWDQEVNGQLDGFGKFARMYKLTTPDNTNRPTKVVVQLKNDFNEEIPGQYQVAVHFIWGSPAASTGSTSINVAGISKGNTQNPDSPFIALPIATLMGTIFILSNKKKE
jgi:hypothetical protein